jgi:putative restriction endonuclease
MAQMAAATGRVFGEIPGYPVGSAFVDGADLARSGVHPPRMKGISGSQNEGADSIVVSGGYEDDHDLSDVIIYTGEGGRDPSTGKQVADQEFRGANRALAVSCDEGLPVRVARGARGDPAHSPATGLRYDGLFHVDRYWDETGISGFRVYRYELVAETSAAPSAGAATPLPTGTVMPAKVQTTVQRIVRSTPVAQTVKRLRNWDIVWGILLGVGVTFLAEAVIDRITVKRSTGEKQSSRPK